MHTISKNAINPKFYQGPSRTFLLGSGLCLHKNDQYIMRQIENYQAQEDNYYLILGLSFTIWMLLIKFLMMLFLVTIWCCSPPWVETTNIEHWPGMRRVVGRLEECLIVDNSVTVLTLARHVTATTLYCCVQIWCDQRQTQLTHHPCIWRREANTGVLQVGPNIQ